MVRDRRGAGASLRRLPPGRLAPAAAALVVVALVLVLAQDTSRGAFSAATGSTGNRVTAATSFCTSTGDSTVTVTADSYVDQANQPSVAGGTADYLIITPQASSVRRIFLRFPMPNVSPGCDVTLATLRIYADGVTANRTLLVQRANPAAPPWTEAGLSWSNQPAGVGTTSPLLLTSGNGYKSWTVTDTVREMYASSNNGFVVRDGTEGGAGAWQQFHARHLTYPATLRVVWG